MAGPYYDEFGRQIIFNNSTRPGRYRDPEPRVRYHREIREEDVYYSPEPARTRHHRGSTSGQPQQIIINNENFIDEHQHQPEYIERPRSSNTQRVIVQEQQIVKVRSKSPAELSYETRRALDELERMKKDKDHDELVKRMKHDLKLEEAAAHEAAEKKKEDEKKMKEKAIEEWKAAEAKKAQEAKEKEAEKEKIGQEYMRQQLRKDGYSEEQIEYLMSKKAAEKKKRDHSPAVSSTQIVIAERPTYLKVHKKHIDPITLDHYKIKWEWADTEYIYIKETISEADQDILFEHTEKLREKKLIKFAEVETVTVNKIAKDRSGRLLMVRKKEDKRERSKSPAVVRRKYYLDS